MIIIIYDYHSQLIIIEINQRPPRSCVPAPPLPIRSYDHPLDSRRLLESGFGSVQVQLPL